MRKRQRGLHKRRRRRRKEGVVLLLLLVFLVLLILLLFRHHHLLVLLGFLLHLSSRLSLKRHTSGNPDLSLDKP